MKKNYLHIWPRFTFMLIALPNKKDNSFVLTLFMPFDIFASLTDEAKLMQFFEEKFPDALPLIGRFVNQLLQRANSSDQSLLNPCV